MTDLIIPYVADETGVPQPVSTVVLYQPLNNIITPGSYTRLTVGADGRPTSGDNPQGVNGALQANLPGGGFKGTNFVGDSSDPTSLVVYSQLAAIASGNRELLPAAAVATSNVSSLSGLQAFDTVAGADGLRVLLVVQTTQSQNGLWLQHAGAWTRPSDFASASTQASGAKVYISNGTLHAGEEYTLFTDAVTVDTTAEVWQLTGKAGNGEANTLSNRGTDPNTISIVAPKMGVDNGVYGLVTDSPAITILRDAVFQCARFGLDPTQISINGLMNTLSEIKGGTHQTSYATGDLLYASAANTLSKLAGNLASTDLALIMNAGVPRWGTITVPGYAATSSSNVPIATGNQTFLLNESNRGYSVGLPIGAYSASNQQAYLEGTVVSYTGNTLVIAVINTGTAFGNFTDWNINIAARRGVPFIPLTTPVIQDADIWNPQVYLQSGYLTADAAKTSGGAYRVEALTEIALTGAVNSRWAVSTNDYVTAMSEYIAVKPGDVIYGTASFLKETSQAGVTPLGYGSAGVQQFDKNFMPIAANMGTNNFICTGYDTPADGAIHVQSGSYTIPSTHTSYMGSDGGPVRYIKPVWVSNYNAALSAGTARGTVKSGDVKFWRGALATGDMLKSVYDTTNDGIVDNSQALGGNAPSYYAPIASPALTGTPTTPTATTGTNTTQIASTAFVAALSATKAPLASPAFTGTPTAPTPAANNNSTQLATTAYTDAADALKAPLASPTFTGTPAAPTASQGNNSTQLATTAYADTLGATKAPLASPALTGTPTAPTATAGTNTTQIATTAFVAAAVTGGGGSSYAGCVVNRATNQTIANATDTYVNWNNELWNITGYHSNTTNNTRLQVPTGQAGRYRLECSVFWNSAVTAGKFGLFLYKNGTQVAQQSVLGGSTASRITNFVSYYDNLVVGDYFEILLNQNSASSNDVTTVSEFSIHRLQ